jgi:hypothetical protein
MYSYYLVVYNVRYSASKDLQSFIPPYNAEGT